MNSKRRKIKNNQNNCLFQLRQMFAQPQLITFEDMESIVNSLSIKKDTKFINLASACALRIPEKQLRKKITEDLFGEFSELEVIQKMFINMYASCGDIDQSFQILEQTQLEKSYLVLKNIAVAASEYLTEDYCDILLEWWNSYQGEDTVEETKETFFAILININMHKYIEAACHYVYIWRKKLQEVITKKVDFEPITDQERQLLEQPPIDNQQILTELQEVLRKTLSASQLEELMKEIIFEVPHNAIFVDASNLYNAKKEQHSCPKLAAKVTKELANYDLIPIFVGHHYRITEFRNQGGAGMCFSIPEEAEACSDDLIWQILSLIHQRKFLTKDAGRDHIYVFSKQYKLWYRMNWMRWETTNNIIFPPDIWPRAQINQQRLFLPVPEQKNHWMVSSN